MPEPYYSDEWVTILHGDCRDLLPELVADVVVTDPPYGIGFRSDPRRHAAPSSSRPSRPSGGIYGQDWGFIVGDEEPFDPAPILALALPSLLWGAHCFASRLPDSAGWLVWDKKRGGTDGRGFISSDVDLAWTNFLGHSLTYGYLWDGMRRDGEIGQHLHPTQKPLELMHWCVNLAPPGTVLDPFMGSGTTLRAAKDLGRKAIGIEIEERYCEIAARRMGQEVLAL
jgi:site-specific DNA-methyltransferase (adenine-specific)